MGKIIQLYDEEWKKLEYDKCTKNVEKDDENCVLYTEILKDSNMNISDKYMSFLMQKEKF